MPPHLALYDENGDPAEDITITLSGGEESDVIIRQIWNDKDSAEGDTTTAISAALSLLMSTLGGPYVSSGVPALDERWFRARVTGALGTTDPYESGTQPLGVNSELMLGDLPQGGGVEIELQAITPGGGTATNVSIKFDVNENRASSPLSKFTALASGSGVVPADRVDGLLALVSGGEVTADDSDTIEIARGKLITEGVIVAYPTESETFSLADGAASNLTAGQDYHVTLSRTIAGALVVTKGLKAEEVLFPDVPAGNILVATLNVTSPDGVAVAVAQSSVTQAARYGAYSVVAGSGLSVVVARGDGITSPGDLRQYLTNSIVVNVVASQINRIWRIGDGGVSVTQSDVPPEFGADLLALAITDAGAVTSVTDSRRFVHRALTTLPIDLVYQAVLTAIAEPSHALALAYAPYDIEIEAVELNLSGVDAGFTADSLKIDIFTLGPGLNTPFPAGGAGGATIFTSSATDDARPSIAYNATILRVVTQDHEVRRFPAGTRFMLSVITTMTGPGGEFDEEIRVTLHARRYR